MSFVKLHLFFKSFNTLTIRLLQSIYSPPGVGVGVDVLLSSPAFVGSHILKNESIKIFILGRDGGHEDHIFRTQTVFLHSYFIISILKHRSYI